MVLLGKPASVTLLRNRGTVSWLHGDAAAAKPLLEPLMGGEGRDTALRWHLYGIYDALGLRAPAARQLRSSGLEWRELVNIADVHVWPGEDWETALVWYRRALILQENSTVLFKMGRAYELNHQPWWALDAYNRALELADFGSGEVGASDVLVRLASLHIRELHDLERAQVLVDQALELDQFGAQMDEKAEAYYLRGQVGSKQGRDPTFCIRQYRQTLEIAPEHYWANLNLGWEYQRLGLLDEAVDQIRYAISLRPEGKWGYLFLAEVYVNAEELAKAERYYRQVLEIDPEDGDARQFLQEQGE
jgi:tetratricopeptide (TPR) repeat protein